MGIWKNTPYYVIGETQIKTIPLHITWCLPKGFKNLLPHKTYTPVNSNFIHNCQNLKAIKGVLQ